MLSVVKNLAGVDEEPNRHEISGVFENWLPRMNTGTLPEESEVETDMFITDANL
jgi:hypothetical protein